MCLAIPGRVVSVSACSDDAFRTAKVTFGGIAREVSVALVPEVKTGEYVLVHVGVAIGIVDEQEALRTFEYLRALGDLDEVNSLSTNAP